jgi:enoyl-CoA hydratase/carnithine racemase
VTGTPALMEKIRDGHAIMNKIERSPKPIIAAINGRYCLGGGSELALACHIRIAEEKVKLGQTEIKLGLIPGWGGTQRLARLVGLGKAVELILTGDHIRADEAYRIGLVNRVVPAGEALPEALRMAKRIATLGGVAIAKALDAIYAGLDMELDAGLAYEIDRFAEVAETEDIREGLSAFLEKRRPQFKDR